MTSERECFVYIVPPGATEFVTAGRFRWADDGDGTVGQFVYGRSYRERADAVELDPVELRLSGEVYETARMQGFFGAIRDSMPDFWGRRVIERNAGFTELTEFDYLMQGPDDRAGALGFGTHVEPPAPRRRFSRTLELAGLQRVADALVADDPELAGSVGHSGRGAVAARHVHGRGPTQKRSCRTTRASGSRSSAATTTAGTIRASNMACSPSPGHAVWSAADSRLETVAGARRIARPPLRPRSGGCRVSAPSHGQRPDAAAHGRHLRRAGRLVLSAARRRNPPRERGTGRRSARVVRTDLLQRRGLQSRRSPAQSRNPGEGTAVAPQPGLRSDALTGGGS